MDDSGSPGALNPPELPDTFDPLDHDPLAGLDDPDEEPSKPVFSVRRALVVIGVLAVLVGLAVLPPLVNVSRYQHRIATSISESLGRPVRLDAVTLTMLPWPGFEITNFVVAEDPAFGSEPVIRANTVRATLRVSSLWRRRVEFSKISFIEPSLNLVHLHDGRWNLESILVQASRVAAAPTAQAVASEEPRFPYIEATDARVNLKDGMEKLPFSLTEAEFALWLAQPERWQLRLDAHPTRTDTSVSDTGTLRMEGTLGRAASVVKVPIDLKLAWTAAPLGAVSWIVLDRDSDVRGTMELTSTLRGMVGDNTVTARLQLHDARRAEFVPAEPLQVDLACHGRATNLLHTFDDVQCAWPQDAIHPGLTLSGSMPDVRNPSGARAMAWISGVPASELVSMLRVASERIPPDLALSGTVDGRLTYPPALGDGGGDLLGEFTVSRANLRSGISTAFVDGTARATMKLHEGDFGPVPLNLGGKEPAELTGRFTAEGYSLHLTGSVLRTRLLAFGAAIPQVGDGLEDALPDTPSADISAEKKPVAETPIAVDLLSQRDWGGEQEWTEAPIRPPVKRNGHRR